MKKLILLGICTCYSFLAYNQTVSVKDFETGEPVAFATLTSDTPKAFSLTNEKGHADISAFKGSEAIEIRMLGYDIISVSFTHLEKESFEINLIPSSISMEGVVVSATRWNQSSYDVPSKVISVTPKMVDLQNPQTAANLLNVSHYCLFIPG